MSDESWTQAARWKPADRHQASWYKFSKSTLEALSSSCLPHSFSFLIIMLHFRIVKTRRLFIEKMGVVEEKKGRHRSRSRERKRSRERGGASRSKSREKKKVPVRIKNSDVLKYTVSKGTRRYPVPLDSSVDFTITGHTFVTAFLTCCSTFCFKATLLK
jgi:hypothetical protein